MVEVAFSDDFKKIKLILFSIVTVIFVGVLACFTSQQIYVSSLSESGDNLQYDLAFAKANFAADEVEVKNSIARLKEMDKLLHSSKKQTSSSSILQLREEGQILSDKSKKYRADSFVAEDSADKLQRKAKSVQNVQRIKQLRIEEQDDKLLASVFARKANKVESHLRISEQMALAMQRFHGHQQLFVGAVKELHRLEGAKSDLLRDASKVKHVLNEMSQRPASMVALPDRKVESAEREALAIERLGQLRRRDGLS